ncbi:protein-L-isoaspartate(D-aspartate) O-methyltransferase [Desulfurococcus mucosus]|uniref:Protein-L-isoaspartate O-methyltransferase n=1 Tax=Desulfurococcus mucosus (strain ATCC 35584 / DSM 2162 / JCM 9187 / O7/1) TaxID=765177 RepID=E8RA78_DESM0|nr:protein-L-isoaspartate(D-aspartate) O-methyltransferase [Desulfurococcus mucosus]ADV65384.1 protein-L-isoaspartate O-methyltransferase [Desulfurococcus mucosus DSM 2162]
MQGFEEQRRLVVEGLRSLGYIRSEKTARALLRVPREAFLPPQLREYAYYDTPLPIGYGQTISAIHMVAIMTDELDPEPGDKVLEVGTGSGYQAAVLAEIVARSDPGRKGHVYSVERIPELAEYARTRLREAGYGDDVTVVVGDGTLGLPGEAPFNRVIVTAATPAVPPPLIDQLADGGRLVAPVGDRFSQRLVIVEKKGGSITKRYGMECVFVPLIGRYGWHPDSE